MKKYIYSLVMAMSAMLATTFTSCDSDANILQADETIGVYAGDVIVEYYATRDGLEIEGKSFNRGDLIAEYYYSQAEGDSCFMFLNVSNQGNASLMLSVPSDPASETTSDYYMFVDNLPISELGNRIATIGVRDLSFGMDRFNTKTLYHPYKDADFDYVEDGESYTDKVSGEAAFICGNYQLVASLTIAEDTGNDLDGMGLFITFSGWLNQGKDANDLIKRRNKR